MISLVLHISIARQTSRQKFFTENQSQKKNFEKLTEARSFSLHMIKLQATSNTGNYTKTNHFYVR